VRCSWRCVPSIAASAARDQQLKAALAASHTTLQQLHGIGPVLAAILLGRIGDITRFPTTGHFAAYCGVAPIEASSGAVIRHRLSRAVDRQLNAALHMMAVTQAGSHPLGRAYYLRKQTEGHSKADVVYRRVRRDAISEQVAPATRPGNLGLTANGAPPPAEEGVVFRRISRYPCAHK
jgi:transposase